MTDVCICSATTVVTEQAFGQSPNVGTLASYAREDHTHGTPSNPVPSRTITNQTANRTSNIVYTNTDTTRSMLVFISTSVSINPGGQGGPRGASIATLLADSNNPPTTEFGTTGIDITVGYASLIVIQYGELVAYVAPGQNYKLTTSGNATIRSWMELLL